MASQPEQLMEYREVLVFHLFGGVGGGADGFNQGFARIGNLATKSRCIGSVDVDLGAMTDFNRRFGGGARGTVLDLFDRAQYKAYHGKEPPRDWVEATAPDIRKAANREFPNIVFLSAPCVGFSGLLSESKSRTQKYQALNGLTLRGVFLMLEAFKDNLPELVIFENVPRISTRGRHLLDQIQQLLRHYGYAVALTTHDCGELGGLAQSRKRFLLVARHKEKVPVYLYEPPKRRLKAVGEILSRMKLPGDPAAGPMHKVPMLNWKTWVRLAFVEAGKDWRSLKRLEVEDGKLKDYLLIPECRGGYLGVTRWDQHRGAITGRTRPTTDGGGAVADPTWESSAKWNNGKQYGVLKYENTVGAIGAGTFPGQGAFSVADPMPLTTRRFGNIYRVVRIDQAAPTIITRKNPMDGATCVADPRLANGFKNSYVVRKMEQTAPTVTTGWSPSNGAASIADPRPDYKGKFNNCYRVIEHDKPSQAVTTGGHPGSGGLAIADPAWNKERDASRTGPLGVCDWSGATKTIGGESWPTNGEFSVADPRPKGWEIDSGKYNVTEWKESSGSVIGGSDYGAFSVADPRPEWEGRYGNMVVTDWEKTARTVTSGGKGPQGGALSVADPRPGFDRNKGDNYLTAGHYGVVAWNEPSGGITACARHDNGYGSVADIRSCEDTEETPRIEVPADNERLVARIISEDNTWHRPFTTLELAALQSLIEPEEYLELEGSSDSAWRKRIGNAVPPAAAKAIADEMFRTLLLAWTGETFQLSATPIWVRNVAVALSVAPDEAMEALDAQG